MSCQSCRLCEYLLPAQGLGPLLPSSAQGQTHKHGSHHSQPSERLSLHHTCSATTARPLVVHTYWCPASVFPWGSIPAL